MDWESDIRIPSFADSESDFRTPSFSDWESDFRTPRHSHYFNTVDDLLRCLKIQTERTIFDILRRKVDFQTSLILFSDEDYFLVGLFNYALSSILTQGYFARHPNHPFML